MALIKCEKREANLYELEFSIPADVFVAAIKTGYEKNAEKFNIAGFRKGKAPQNMIEKMYGDEVFFDDAVNEALPDAFDAALLEAKLEPIDRPIIDVKSATRADGAVITAKVLVKPEVELGNYKGLKATKTVNAVDELEVQAEIDALANRNARSVPREGAAEMGDSTIIDFEGFVDGVAFDGGKGENFPLELGGGQFIPGFEEQLVGRKQGDEFDITVNFPAEYQAAELAGKEATFKIKLHDVKLKQLPIIDDEFAKDVSDFETLEEFKTEIRKKINESNERDADLKVENDLVEQIVAAMKVELPAIMVEQRIDELIREFAYRLEGQGLTLENYLKYLNIETAAFRETFKDQADKQVKIRLALDKIASIENIKPSDEDVDKEFANIAEMYKMDLAKIKELVPAEEIAKDLAANKVVDYVRSVSVIKEEAPKKEKAAKADKADKPAKEEKPAKEAAPKKAAPKAKKQD